MVKIQDSTGSGYGAKVNDEGQLSVQSESKSMQHHVSLFNGQAYQVIGDFATVNNATHTILHLKNTSSTKKMVITYVRFQALDLTGGTAIPHANTYFQVGFNTTYSSGGTEVTPVQLNRGSGNVAEVTAYDNNATVAGTFLEADRLYLQSEGNMHSFNKEGTIILGQNDTMEVRFTSDHTAGVAYARVSFVMVENGS